MTAEELRRGPFADAVRRHRLVVVLRRIEPRDHLLALCGELADAGARIFEVTMDAPTGAEDLAVLRAALAQRGDGPFHVGAGTVRTAEQLAAARAAGAEFAVAPLLDLELLAASLEAGLPFVPGAFTPTEISAAWAAGATFVKLFPASAAGPAMLRELRGPLPEVEIIPTGGIDASNAAAFLEAGATAVGIGGGLTRAGADARRALVRRVAGS